jgi:hypothetical protein
MSKQEPTGKEFKVRVDVQLPEEALARIDRAIQKAVLHELAETDVADGYSVIMRAPASGEFTPADRPRGEEFPDPFAGLGSTDGIWIREERSTRI